jgi:hypothetical protein
VREFEYYFQNIEIISETLLLGVERDFWKKNRKMRGNTKYDTINAVGRIESIILCGFDTSYELFWS